MREGVKVKIGGKDYVVPALTIRLMKEHKGDLKALNETTDQFDQLDLMLKVVLSALKLNYPEMDGERLQDEMDLRALPAVFSAVMGVSDLANSGGEPMGESTGTA